MRMNDKLSIGTGRDREAAPDIRTEVRMDTIRAYWKKKLRSDQILSDKIDGKYLSDAMGRRKGAAAVSYTHLDVYKRQLFRLSRRPASMSVPTAAIISIR